MVGSILCGLAIFGVSEITGEVYHAYHHNDDNNVIINTARKLADCADSAAEKIDAQKAKYKSKHELNKVSSPKTIMSSSASVDNIVSALDAEITRIKSEKDYDIKKIQTHVAASIVKVCDILTDAANLDEKSLKSVATIKKNAEGLINMINDGLSEDKVKKQIVKLSSYLQPYIEKNKEIESSKVSEEAPQVTDEQKPGTFKVTGEDKTHIPDFTKPTTPIGKVTDTKVSDVKVAAAKGGNKASNGKTTTTTRRASNSRSSSKTK